MHIRKNEILSNLSRLLTTIGLGLTIFNLISGIPFLFAGFILSLIHYGNRRNILFSIISIFLVVLMLVFSII